MSRGGWAALPRGATVLFAVCDCGISGSYSLTIFFIAMGLIWADSFMIVGFTSFIFNDIGLYGTNRLSNDSFGL